LAKRISKRKQILQEEIEYVSEIGFSLGSVPSYNQFGVQGFNMLTVKDANDICEFHMSISRILEDMCIKAMAMSCDVIETEEFDALPEGDE